MKKLKDIIAKKLKGYKTLIANILATTLPILVVVNPNSLNLSKEELAYFTVFVTIANIYLRFKTTTPIGKK